MMVLVLIVQGEKVTETLTSNWDVPLEISVGLVKVKANCDEASYDQEPHPQ